MAEWTLPALLQRPVDGHKGTFGTVVVVGGSWNMVGAPALAAGAALRSGCGLAKIAAPTRVVPFCLSIEPCATGIALPGPRERVQPFSVIDQSARQSDVLAVGPGMGIGPWQAHLVEAILGQPRSVVLDADGLNNLAAHFERFRQPHCPLVITPHPGEAQRLAEAIGIRFDPISHEGRADAAIQLAEACHAVVVLKGNHTVVTDGAHVHVNETGNVALATAGSGDVLTGLVASLIAQGMGAFEGAALGAHLHGLAGDLWAEQHGPMGMTARELLALVPQAFTRYASGP